MEKKWVYLGDETAEEGLNYHVFQCKKCGAKTFMGDWTEYGVIEDVVGCDHWSGFKGDDEVEYEQQTKKTE